MRILLAVLSLACLAGCMDLQAAFHYPNLTTEYRVDGFSVRDDFRVFTFKSRENKSTLKIHKSVILEDLQSDGKIDIVKLGTDEYTRGEPGTVTLFREKDEEWRDYTHYMSIGHFKRKWESMDPASITQQWGRSPHEP
ncbi:MAG: hypothetical protein ACYTHM_01200 [Planctomycetota bacterium]|jgi:hypothetical protein